MKVLIVFLVLLLAVLQYKLWFAEGGVRDVHQIKKQVDEKIAENTQLEQRNAALVAEVEDLKRGGEAIEERARNDLGMVKEGERYYQIVD